VTDQSFILDTSDRNLRRSFNINAIRKLRERKKIFQSVSVDNIDIHTDVPYSKDLFRFFRMREMKRR